MGEIGSTDQSNRPSTLGLISAPVRGKTKQPTTTATKAERSEAGEMHRGLGKTQRSPPTYMKLSSELSVAAQFDVDPLVQTEEHQIDGLVNGGADFRARIHGY